MVFNMVPIFFDPLGRRWKFLRRMFYVVLPLVSILVIAFSGRILSKVHVPLMFLPPQHCACRALTSEKPDAAAGVELPPHPSSELLSLNQHSDTGKGIPLPFTSRGTPPVTLPCVSRCRRLIYCFPSGYTY